MEVFATSKRNFGKSVSEGPGPNLVRQLVGSLNRHVDHDLGNLGFGFVIFTRNLTMVGRPDDVIAVN